MLSDGSFESYTTITRSKTSCFTLVVGILYGR